uniref:Protein dispatched homolog 1-like n=1 Tax=Saccoglossus kowalevskii TaxID=10224 RepID=A0ABM0MCH7_SACKO|nr:PREDICTED: protein dispatched homolog 1-like [Saccoglossus kowalevskii]
MAKMVFGPTANVNLFTVTALKSMCSLEEELIALDSPCLSWSLGNSVAVFNGKSSCLNITDEDVDKMLETLLNCEGYYNDGTLHDDCWQTSQCSVPTYCAKYNIVYNIFHFLTSINFKPSEGTVKTAITVLPVYRYNDDLIEIFQKSFPDGKPVSDGISTVTSLDFEIKSDIFSDYLLEDSKYGVIAACIILLFMWLYIGSIFIVLMAVLSMFFSLIFAYFIYTVVLQIFFFPFMNMLAFVLLIAIGADDAFVYCDIWKHTKQANAQSTKESIIGKALRHGFLTMFVTSFTTAAALFANIVNPITSIRCFSIYTGIAILCNFILTVTWLPAAVSLHDICSAFLCCEEHSPIMKNLLVSTCCTGVRKISFFFTETGRIFFDKLLPWLVIKFRYLWLIMLSLFTIGGFIVVFVTPKLSLPTVNDLQLFTSSHLLETYQLKYKDRFHFENVQNKEIYGQAPVRVVFGIEANDNGDYLDPDNFGNVTFTSTFDVSTAASQEWLLNFCAQLRNQSFILTSQGVQIENCLIETFKWWMDSRVLLDTESLKVCIV